MQMTIFTRNLLLSLFVIYFAQGSFYPTGSIISQGSLVVILLLSGIYLVKTLQLINNKNMFYKAWTALLTLNVVGFFFTGSLANEYHFSMFKGIMITALPFYPFYHFARKGVLKSKHLLWFLVLILPVTILQYFLNASQILEGRISDNTNVVNNVAYSFVALIPFVFFLKKKKIIGIGLMLVLMFFIIQGAKRGALIAGIIGLLCFVYFQLRTVPKKKRFKGFLLVLIAIAGMSYYAYDVYMSNEYLVSRMQSLSEGNTSERYRIYLSLFNAWFESDSFLSLIFGFGFASSIVISDGSFAHNDWLELLSNFGLLGIIVYAILFYSATKHLTSSVWDVDKRIMLLSILLIWFFSTLVSMSYTSGNGYIQTILLAYLLGNKSKNLE